MRVKITKTKVYTAAELKRRRKDGGRAFERALEKYRENLDLEHTSAELLASLKGLCEAAGVRIVDYSLGAYNRGNRLEVRMDDGAAGLKGPRALAWIENRILGPLRAPWGLPKNLKPGAPLPEGFTRGWDPVSRAVLADDGAPFITRWTRPGAVPSCPFTGVCYDEDFLEALTKDLRDGRTTLYEAFTGLESDFARILEDEYEYQSRPDQFLEAAAANAWEFDEEGNMA